MKNIYKKILAKQPVIIAEAGVNHNGKIAIGKKLIKAAKRAGADCIKFQTYKAKKLTIKKAKRFQLFDRPKTNLGGKVEKIFFECFIFEIQVFIVFKKCEQIFEKKTIIF